MNRRSRQGAWGLVVAVLVSGGLAAGQDDPVVPFFDPAANPADPAPESAPRLPAARFPNRPRN